jgi:hypothetical protein
MYYTEELRTTTNDKEQSVVSLLSCTQVWSAARFDYGFLGAANNNVISTNAHLRIQCICKRHSTNFDCDSQRCALHASSHLTRAAHSLVVIV